MDLVSDIRIKVPASAWWRTMARGVTSSFVLKVKLPPKRHGLAGPLPVSLQANYEVRFVYCYFRPMLHEYFPIQS